MQKKGLDLRKRMFTSYNVLDGVSGVPSLNKNSYINVSTRDFDARN